MENLKEIKKVWTTRDEIEKDVSDESESMIAEGWRSALFHAFSRLYEAQLRNKKKDK